MMSVWYLQIGKPVTTFILPPVSHYVTWLSAANAIMLLAVVLKKFCITESITAYWTTIHSTWEAFEKRACQVVVCLVATYFLN